MEGNILSLAILDFENKIFFFNKRPEFPLEMAFKMTKSISKSVKQNYLKDFINKQIEFRLMDTVMSPKVKVKVSLLWEISVVMLYSSTIDLNLVNLYNQRLIETLYYIAKTKKIKMEMLVKRYNETNCTLVDTLYFLSPKVRFSKNVSLVDDTDIHNIYYQRFIRASRQIKTLAYYHSSKNFIKTLGELGYNKKQNNRMMEMKFEGQQFVDQVLKRKMKRFKMNGVVRDIKKEKEKETKDDSSEDEDKLKDQQEEKKQETKDQKSTQESKPANNQPKEDQSLLQQTINSLQNVDFTNIINNLVSEETQEKAESNTDKPEKNAQKVQESNPSPNKEGFSQPNTPLQPSQDLQPLSSLLGENFNFNIPSRETNQRAKSNTKEDLNDTFDSHSVSPPKKVNISQFYFPDTQTMGGLQQKKESQKQNSLQEILNLIPIQTEDKFNPLTIKKQLRCSISEKEILITTGNQQEEHLYRGGIVLELTKNFKITNKTLSLTVHHPNWTDNNYFTREAEPLVKSENSNHYTLACVDIKKSQRVLNYTPNLKLIKKCVDIFTAKSFENETYTFEMGVTINKKFQPQMKSSQIVIEIITKTNEIVILKASNKQYKIEYKKVAYEISDFHTTDHKIGLIFKTPHSDFIETVKVSYRYMGVLQTSLNASVEYKDESGNDCHIDVVKKCEVEIRFNKL